MAEVKSLGVHTPVGLPYLIAEGILPPDSSPESYKWDVYAIDDGDEDLEEEILTTSSCVVWSQGKFVRHVFRFEHEGETVVQAVLTQFPGHDTTKDYVNQKPTPRCSTGGLPRVLPKGSNDQATIVNDRDLPRKSPADSTSSSRALAIFLRSKVHIHFIHGPSYIADVPFEIERAIPAPRGVLLQRKVPRSSLRPPTPQVPSAPPNSFLSTQFQTSASHLQSPTFLKSFASTQPSKPSPLGGNGGLESLYQEVLGKNNQSGQEEVAGLYTLTGPLSDYGVVTYSLQQQKPRLSSRKQPGPNVEFEALEASERVIYASARDELRMKQKKESGQLMLIVTANEDLKTLTVWHAWYIEGKSLAALLKQRASHKVAKIRRRSSFLSPTMGTGATTPAVRSRDGPRESFTNTASLRVPGETAHAQSSKNPTRKDEEDAMASQMDPDFQPGASQRAVRESRRISSLNSEVRTSQYNASASLGGHGGRRNTSFGGQNERKSFGHRRSRGSTPGSVFSRSIGVDDDTMDLDDSATDVDGEEAVDSILRHARATFETAGADSVFGGTDDVFRRELVVRKLHSLPLMASAFSSGDLGIKCATLGESYPPRDHGEERVNLYIHDKSSGDLLCLQMSVNDRGLWPELSDSPRMAIPVITLKKRMGRHEDLVRLRMGPSEVLYLGQNNLLSGLDDDMPFVLPITGPYRVHDLFNVTHVQSPLDTDVERNRMFSDPVAGGTGLVHAGARGAFDELAQDGQHHRRQLKLAPDNDDLRNLIHVCQIVLPSRQAQVIYGLWYMSYAKVEGESGKRPKLPEHLEWTALATVLNLFLMPLIDEKAVATARVTQVASTAPTESTQRSSFGARSWGKFGLTEALSGLRSASTQVRPAALRTDDMLAMSVAVAADLLDSSLKDLASRNSLFLSREDAVKLMLGLHIYFQERKLCTLLDGGNETIAVLVAHVGTVLGLRAWSAESGQYYTQEGANEKHWSFMRNRTTTTLQVPLMDDPVSALQWYEYTLQQGSVERFPSLAVLAQMSLDKPLNEAFKTTARELTPRLVALSDVIEATESLSAPAVAIVEAMVKCGLTGEMIDSLPEGVAAPLNEAIARCERTPPTTWSRELLTLVGREDLIVDGRARESLSSKIQPHNASTRKDVNTICHALDHQSQPSKTKEAGRHAVSQLIFNEDRRLVEATSLMHFNSPQVAECPKQPDWSDAYHFEQQRRVMQNVTTRMISLPAGDAMIHFDSQTPLLTDKYHLPGFNSSCLIQPMGHTLTTDRSGLTEEKVSWAYFHAGVSSGLRISRNVRGIDTSWIVFNKPNDLTNRHAGLLLALGLSGHLRHLAKWLSFKYLTPKHTTTSVGLLLGLSASYMGSMDGLITRMLSVHITRMLPAGAAELNVSPVTQTAGLMGIGLLYHNTQHRRMSEIMLSEVEQMDIEDPDSGPDPLRGESYRLAAGLALGFINLGKGNELQGLYGIHLPERLLAVAVGARPVNAVHVFDRATAGAVIAITLVYMKTGDKTVAQKIDIPDTETQFDHVRPDMLMLRAMARHIILWNEIEAKEPVLGIPAWTQANLPACYQSSFSNISASRGKHPLQSSDVPFFNIATGLAWALSLKYAGSGDHNARDEILAVLDHFSMVKGGGDAFYYDAKLARSTVRRCVEILALAAATVMAGTGDLKTFRYLRRLHGRTDAETPYGSHMATHLAIGVLFLGGGTYTLGTSNLAVASLICAFYPLFPTDVQDNHVHLQAFRHLWVFAAEARCLVTEDVDTRRPIPLPITVTTRDGFTRSMSTPCLLPSLDTIITVQTSDPSYWRATFDFASNPAHLRSFNQDQRLLVRRCPASEAHANAFSATLAALNDVNAPLRGSAAQLYHSIFALPAFRELMTKADIEIVLPPDPHSGVYLKDRETNIDARMEMNRALKGGEKESLWGLRVLFAWAEKASGEGDEKLRWIGREVVDGFKAKLQEERRIAEDAEESDPA